ncbi:MAG: chromate transporter [Clostridia bacterium]|nr:chromate transporter [Clostridia bacterium]
MPLLLDLFLSFAKIGLFTFGGGYAMISVIDSVCVENKKWITAEEMARLTVLAESTPGPIAINCSTYVGFRQKGFLGAIVATCGMVLPSFVILYAISLFFDSFLEIPLVAGAFQGIKLAVGLLVAGAALKLFKKMKKTPFSLILVLSSFVLVTLVGLLGKNLSTVTVLLGAGVLGLIVFWAGKAASAGKGGDQ